MPLTPTIIVQDGHQLMGIMKTPASNKIIYKNFKARIWYLLVWETLPRKPQPFFRAIASS